MSTRSTKAISCDVTGGDGKIKIRGRVNLEKNG